MLLVPKLHYILQYDPNQVEEGVVTTLCNLSFQVVGVVTRLQGYSEG